MRRLAFGFVVVGALALLMACGHTAAPPAPDVVGMWEADREDLKQSQEKLAEDVKRMAPPGTKDESLFSREKFSISKTLIFFANGAGLDLSVDASGKLWANATDWLIKDGRVVAGIRFDPPLETDGKKFKYFGSNSYDFTDGMLVSLEDDPLALRVRFRRLEGIPLPKTVPQSR